MNTILAAPAATSEVCSLPVPRQKPEPLIKRCPPPCGKVYTLAQWRELHLVGTMDDGAGGTLELRNCVCETTLAVEL